MDFGKFTPVDFDNFTPTELRMPGIKEYLHDVLGKLFETYGFKFKKSDFTFKRKHGKSSEQFMFLFYNYHPLNYSFTFLFTVFNEEIENIKLSLPPQKHHSSFNKYSAFLSASDFTNHISIDSLYETGYDYTVTFLDDLVTVGKALNKTFVEEGLPLADRLTTIEGIDKFFAEKTSRWSVNTGSVNNVCTELIAAKLNGKRDYQKVYEQLCNDIKSSEDPNLQTLTVVENLYTYLKST